MMSIYFPADDKSFYLLPVAYVLALFAVVWLLHKIVVWQKLQQHDWYAAVHLVCLLSMVIMPVLFVFVLRDTVAATIMFCIFITATIVNMEHVLWHSPKANWLRMLFTGLFILLHFIGWFFYAITNFAWAMD